MLCRTIRLWRAAYQSDLLSGYPPALIHHRGKKSKSKAKTSKPQLASQQDSSDLDFSKYEQSMQKAVDVLNNSYSRLRVGGATPGILDDISVDAYGARTALKNLAQVSVRDGRTLLVTIHDEGTSKSVEKAIRAAGLNLNPVVEANGKLRVPVPKPSNETRVSLREVASKEAEAAKVATRMIRRKAMDEVKRFKDELSKDEVRRMEASVQAMTDRHISSITEAQAKKISAIEGGIGR